MATGQQRRNNQAAPVVIEETPRPPEPSIVTPEAAVEVPTPSLIETSAAEKPAEAPKAEEKRERKAGAGPECPGCGGNDTFVTTVRRHPSFIEQRLRYYKCGKCSHTFKA